MILEEIVPEKKPYNIATINPFINITHLLSSVQTGMFVAITLGTGPGETEIFSYCDT